jgi:16S rRNA (guanine966-N2)-methyltransferase
LRIIGGRWRGQRLGVPAGRQLRPTPDRVRETLFNWLQADLPGARCLDLFAGSGALGFEALSRGARQVVMVERDRRVAAWLREQGRRLEAVDLQVHTRDARAYLRGAAVPFDIVFLDPPFGGGWLPRICPMLESGGWLADPAAIYVEAESGPVFAQVPSVWSRAREGHAGQVWFGLLRRAGGKGGEADP